MKCKWIRNLALLMLPLAISAVACNAPVELRAGRTGLTADNLLETVQAMPTPTVLLFTETPSHSPTPGGSGESSGAPTLLPTLPGPAYEYITRAGDTVESLAARFDVKSEDIAAQLPLPSEGYLEPGRTLVMPVSTDSETPGWLILPDSEFVFSPTGAEFDLDEYIRQAGGYLSLHRESVEEDKVLTGTQIIQRVASEFSINPRLLLAILEMRSGWVLGHPPGAAENRYPIGFNIPDLDGLYEELKVVATQLHRGYYGWREGSLDSIEFEDGSSKHLDPTLNAGTVAVMRIFSLFENPPTWSMVLFDESGFIERYTEMFGSPWVRDAKVDGLIPPDLTQPAMEFPFRVREGWSLTAGPHRAWNAGTPLGALDFSPIVGGDPCAESFRWVTASAPGVIARASDNAVALDLDGDGFEGTGWVLVYFHLADVDLISPGKQVDIGDRLGHPSCEGGQASGTHVHIARKYNGEWLPADGPVPFVLSGWTAVAGENIYQGQLIKGDEVVNADPSGRSGSTILE